MIFFMNTLDHGSYRWMIFKEGDAWFGVALEFNIVIDGEDPRVVELELQEAVLGYLESVKKVKGFRPQTVEPVLNQETDQEYEMMWAQGQAREPSPFSDIYKLGISNLANV